MTRRRSTARAALVGLAVALVAPFSPYTVVAPAAAADALQCPDVPPNVGQFPPFNGYDTNVNTYVGGDWNVTESAAEGEGVVVVEGNATFDRNPAGIFNLGVVGVGSQVPPPPGSVMLHVGGDLTTVGTNFVDVGAGLDGGGGVNVGGTITTGMDQSSAIITNGAPVQEGMGTPASLVPFDAFGNTLQTTSDSYAAMAPTGTTTDDGFGTLTFTGDGTLDRQVFEVDLNADPGALESATVVFANIDPAAVTVINVIGPDDGSPVNVNTDIFFGGDPFAGGTALGAANLGEWATDLLWNFEDATDVNFDGTAQFIGSIVVPTAGGTVTTSMPGLNGRMYTNGNLTQAGNGTEIHAYPFDDGSEWGCEDEGAAYGIAKIVVDPEGIAPDDLVFTGTFECRDPADDTVLVDGTWELMAGETKIYAGDGVPPGSVCSVTEDTPPDVNGGQWQEPVLNPSEFVVSDDPTQVVTIEVTNTLDALATGFEITKDLTDGGGIVPDGTTFSGTWECTLDGEPVGDGTWELAAGESVTLGEDLPIGSVCTVTEDELPAIDGGQWQDPVISPDSVTLGVAATDEVPTITVANETSIAAGGRFEVAKELDDPTGLVPTNLTYTVLWECTLDGEPAGSGFALVVAGESTPIPAPQQPDLPVGAVCVVSEVQPPDVPGGTWLDPVISSEVVITADGSDSVVIDVTNVFEADETGFVIEKVLENPDEVSVEGVTYTGTWECTLDGEPVGDGTWELSAGETVTVADDLPVGSECTVAEDLPLPELADGVWAEPILPDPVTLVAVAEGVEVPTATVTNEVSAAVTGFEITKVVDDPAGLVPTDVTFSGAWACEINGDPVGAGTWELAAGETVAVADGLPLGSVCTVREFPPLPEVEGGAWGFPEFSGVPVTLEDLSDGSDPVLVTMTNFFEADVVTGFEITKVVSDPDEVLSGTDTYTGSWECTADGSVVGEGDWELVAGETVTVAEGMPVGAECTVTEAELDPVDGATWSDPVIEGAPVTLTDLADGSDPALVTVTNTIAEVVTGFEITKVVTDPDALLTGDETYTGTWACTVDNEPEAGGTWELAADETVTVAEGLPVGAECTVTEDEVTPVEGGVWADPEIDGSPVVLENLADGGEVALVTVSNSLVAEDVVTGFQITKVVEDADGVAPDDAVFTGTWECTYDGTIVGDGTWELGADETVTVAEGLPEGAECTVSEDTPLPTIEGGAWSEPSLPDTVVLADVGDDPLPIAVVTNTATADDIATGFAIRKQLEDADGIVPDGTTFTGDWECTLDGVVVGEGVWELGGGESTEALGADLPVGAECVVTEDASAPLQGGEWAAPVISDPVVLGVDGVDPLPVVTVSNQADATSGGGTLAVTGADASVLVGGAGLLMVLGGVLIGIRRRFA